MSRTVRRHRPRWFLQFSLRTALIVMTLTAICSGIYVGFVAPYKRQHEAGLALAEKGVTIEWRAAEPAWLMAMLRIFFDNRILSDCVGIQAERCGLTDDDLVHLRQIPRLERLYLASNPIGDEGLKHLRDLKRLERLSLWGTKISDDGLQHLAGLGALTVLDIHNRARRPTIGTSSPIGDLTPPWRSQKSFLTAECLKALTRNTSLRAIYFSFSVDDEALSCLAELPNLQLRSLVLQDVTDAGLAYLPQWTSLEAVLVNRAAISHDGLHHVSRLPNLRRLWLLDVQSHDGAWQSLGDLSKLEHLVLNGSSIGDDGMPFIGKLTRLKRLSLKQTRVTDRGASHLRSLTNLQELNLLHTSLSADYLEHLVAMDKLEVLGFHAPLDNEAVACLLRMPKLLRLDPGVLHGSHDFYVTDVGLAGLARLNCVERIHLHDARDGSEYGGVDVPSSSQTMTDAGLVHLWKNPRFRAVDISGRDITTAGLRWTKTSTQCYVVQLHSSRPPGDVITTPLPDEIVAAEFLRGELKIVARDSFGPRVARFQFNQKGCHLEMLRHLPSIERLRIVPNTSRPVLVGGWDNLRFVPNLVEFETPGRRPGLLLDAEAVYWLGEMKNMQKLVIGLPNGFPADDFAPLVQLKRLANLNLHCESLDPEHLHVLSQSTSLQTLRIFAHPRSVTDQDGLRHLIELKKLRELWLYGIQDEGMPHLGRIESLVRLSVNGRQVTNDGLGHLDALPNLEYLDARATGITDQGLEDFRRRHPGVYVRTDR